MATMSGTERGHVCVFAKPPRPGIVKTRLAPELGAAGAAAIAGAFFEDTWAMASTQPWADLVLATTEVDAPEWRRAEPMVRWPQAQGDLGRRMEHVLRRALAARPFAIAIGTDSPGLPSARLDAARVALRTADAVIGPTEDGGFYLLGLRTCPAGILAHVPWSTPETFHRTLDQLRRHGLRTTVLPPWFDVDRPSDLERLRTMLLAGRVSAPATRRALARLSTAGEPTSETPARPRVSLIVPVLNEASRIGAFLTRVTELSPLQEIIVVDGGSTDGTAGIVASVPGCRLIEARRGRGDQLNAGAGVATGDVLWFVHADATLPSNAARLVADAMSDPRLSAGAFRIHTVADGRHGWPARWLGLADLRARFSRSPYGDQAVFVRRTVFDRIGGFPAQPLFEDVELCRRLRRVGPIRVLRASVEVSGRRFMARPLYYAVMMNVLPVLYRLGVPASTLARAYREVR
jgi:hypothetical protein